MKRIIFAVLALAAFTAAATTKAETIVATTSDNRLLFFDSAAPATITKTLSLTGLNSGETVLGIDFRPTNGALYGITSASRGFLADVSSGDTFPGPAGQFTLDGTSFGFDFNPTADRARITSNTGQNLRINPDNGTLTATDSRLAFAPGDANAAATPHVVGSAYTNSFPGAGATVLYDIDSNLDALLIQNPANAGTLTTIGQLGVNTNDNVGFDISGASGVAYASLTVGSTTGLYRINLANGSATLVGPIGDATTLNGATVTDIAVFTPTPTRLLNLSARARVGVGEDVLIGGFFTRGGTPTTMLARAMGPSLSKSGVNGPLQDPILELYDANGTLFGQNDDWRTSNRAAEIAATGLAPTDDRESALYGDILPGPYTLVVRGKNNTSGVALVEIYDLR